MNAKQRLQLFTAVTWAMDAIIGIALRLAALLLLLWWLLTPVAKAAVSCPVGSSGLGLYASGTGLLAQIEALAGGETFKLATGDTNGLTSACTPPEPASVALDGPTSLAGNPVDLTTGVKLERAVDVDLGGAGPGASDDVAALVLSRFYSSASEGSEALGPGWRIGLQVRLYARPGKTGLQFQLAQGDGRLVSFGPGRKLSEAVLVHDAVLREDGRLEQHANAQWPWLWRWRSGRRLHFDEAGLLRRIESLAGPDLQLSYDAQQRLERISSSDGRTLQLRYRRQDFRRAATKGSPLFNEQRLVEVRLRDGLLVRFDYDAAGRLSAVTRADGKQTRYRYADGHRARLVAIEQDQAFSEYRYDSQGRVSYSRAMHDSAEQALQFEYRQEEPNESSTLIRIAGQLVGSYRWRLEPVRSGQAEPAARASDNGKSAPPAASLRTSPARLVHASGPGCARCPMTGVSYRYDTDGRLVEVRRLSAARPGGVPGRLVVSRDVLGRPVKLDWQLANQARSIQITWAKSDAADRVIEMRWPSQSAGRQVRMRPVRDDSGRVLAFEQQGFSPVIAPLPGGRFQVAVQAVTRRSQFPGFASMRDAGWSESQSPQDSLLRWRDDFGRLVAQWSVDAGLVRRRFDEQDRLVSEQRADGAIASYSYDPQGRLVRQMVRDAPGPDAKPSAEVMAHADADSGFFVRSDPESDSERDVNVAKGRQHDVRLHWTGNQLIAVDETDFSESFKRDSEGRLIAHRIVLTNAAGRSLPFTTRYRYDLDGQLSSWSLPGGGDIVLRRDTSGQIIALDWRPRGDGWSQPVVSALSRKRQGLARMVFGNGVVARFDFDVAGKPSVIAHQAHFRLRRERQDVLSHRMQFDQDGRLTGWRRADRQHYSYDRFGRLLQAVYKSEPEPAARSNPSPASPLSTPAVRAWRYAYDHNGNRLFEQNSDIGNASSGQVEKDVRTASAIRYSSPGASNQLQRTDWTSLQASERVAPHASPPSMTPTLIHRDAAGRIVARGSRVYRWDGRGLLREVIEHGRTVARYRYNHRGQRISKQVGSQETLFIHDAQRRLLAEVDAHGGVARQYVYLADRPVAVLDRINAGPVAGGYRLRYLHLNHLGAPEVVTDERSRVIWRADYAPFGRLLSAHRDVSMPGFDLALRLPGQFEDTETGLHYNDHRYYDPDSGRYLSPDPLGTVGGPNPYVYAANDPLSKIDPSGLLLFAFDGTDNGDPPSRQDDWSNVYKLAKTYADGRVWYMAGVGRDDRTSGIQTNGLDALNANTARMRVDYLVAELERYVAGSPGTGQALNVDVIGFSRGAAMARDFSNRVADRIADGSFIKLGACVRLRFIGLWDTVAQFGANGLSNAGWRLAIPEQAAYVAHAVALNEHRFLFPVESIVGSPLAGVRIERGFVGAHADVGGSYAEGDLSDVTLLWMHQQARAAGLRMFALSSELARVTSPLLHDSSFGSGDREVLYRNDWGWIAARPWQRQANVEGMQWRDTGQFIDWYPQPRPDVYGEPTLAADVDMSDYAQWLGANYGLGFIGVI